MLKTATDTDVQMKVMKLPSLPIKPCMYQKHPTVRAAQGSALLVKTTPHRHISILKKMSVSMNSSIDLRLKYPRYMPSSYRLEFHYQFIIDWITKRLRKCISLVENNI